MKIFAFMAKATGGASERSKLRPLFLKAPSNTGHLPSNNMNYLIK